VQSNPAIIYLFFSVSDPDLSGDSTMVWAVDLDDGTLIEALGSNLNRPKAEIYEPHILECNLGTNSHDEL
jgi:hypothetical protein